MLACFLIKAGLYHCIKSFVSIYVTKIEKAVRKKRAKYL